jgi:hypothetical protein
MRLLLTLLPAALIAGAGCSSDNPENAPVVPQPVTGKVIYDGKPAEGVEVTFVPTDAPMTPRIPRNPHGVTAADGTFTLTTFQDGDGAAEGGYLVVLKWPGVPDENAEGGEAAEVPDKLRGWYDGTHSQLTYRVVPGENAVPEFKLPKVVAPPKAAQGVPGRN